MCVNHGFEKAIFRKVMRVKGVRHKSQWIQLWGVALGSNFAKPLSETAFGGSFSSLGEQLFGASFGNNFGERLWGTA